MSRDTDKHEAEEGTGALLFVLLACLVAAALGVFALLHSRWGHDPVPSAPAGHPPAGASR